jgi:ribosome-associated protein
MKMSSFVRIAPDVSIPMSEIEFRFTRSSGPGGQNVNKVSTRVDLLFDVASSTSMREEQKAAIVLALRSRVDGNGVLHLSVQESRSQMHNRELAIEKFTGLLQEALRPRKKRRKTKPTTTSRLKRIESKTHRGTIKKSRGRVDRDF